MRQVTLHEKVELAGCRIDLRDLFDVERRFVGHLIGLVQFTFHLNEDRLHAAPVSVCRVFRF
jgi:hypothetical protein